MDETVEPQPEERRRIDRRLEDHASRIRNLESIMHAMDKTVAVTETRVMGLAQTIESRFRAFDSGLALIVAKQDTAAATAVVDRTAADARMSALETIKKQADGALWVVRTLGVGGVVAFVIWVFKSVTGK